MNKIIINRTKNSQFRFNAIGENGEKVATSETYTRKSKAYQTIAKYFKNWIVEDNTQTRKKSTV